MFHENNDKYLTDKKLMLRKLSIDKLKTHPCSLK